MILNRLKPNSKTTSERVNRVRFRTVDDVHERIQKLLVTGDNRLKQGVALEKVRANYEEALELAQEAGMDDRIRPLVELRLADLERLAGGSPPPSPPDA
jgi:hypothetical protein